MISPLNVCGAWAKMLNDANRQPAQSAIFFIERNLLMPADLGALKCPTH
jgi:hypothetical protein